MAAFRAFEVCDPATNTWDGSLPRMRIPRHVFPGGVIGNRLHVVAGGIQTAGIGAVVYTDTHDVFDFTKNSIRRDGHATVSSRALPKFEFICGLRKSHIFRSEVQPGN